MNREALMYYGLKAGMALAGVLPARIGYALSSALGILLYFMLGSARRAVQANLRHVLGPHASRWRIGSASRTIFRHSVKNYYDLFRLPKLKPQDIEKMITVVGQEHIRAALEKGHGVIICGAHIANFNLIMQVAGSLGFKANVVTETMASSKTNELLNDLRAHFGIHVIQTGPHIVRGIYRALRANELIGLAMDRDVTHTGMMVDVFGAPAMLPTGPIVLSLRLGAPLLPVRIRRETNNNTTVRVYPPVELERTGNNDEDIRRGVDKMARLLEDFVKVAPEQWIITSPIWAQDGGPMLPAPEASASLLPAAVGAGSRVNGELGAGSREPGGRVVGSRELGE